MALPTLDEIFAADVNGVFDGGHLTNSSKPETASWAARLMEEVNDHYAKTGKLPSSDGEIMEKSLAKRFGKALEDDTARSEMAELDTHGLLSQPEDDLDGEDAFEALMNSDLLGEPDPVYQLEHVSAPAAKEKEAPDTVAQREPCAEFDRFRPIFDQVQQDIQSGERDIRPFVNEQDIKEGDFFILNGVTVYVAEIGRYSEKNGKRNARARFIYSNEQESHGLLRSLATALYEDDSGRRISRLTPLPLLDPIPDTNGTPTGTVYVLRSLSEDPQIAPYKQMLHKIGVTNGKVETRIKKADTSPTYLMADVEIVATYDIYSGNARALEKLLHKVFDQARASIEIADRYNRPVRSTEWFMVPFSAVSEAIRLVQTGKLSEMRYDPTSCRFHRRA